MATVTATPDTTEAVLMTPAQVVAATALLAQMQLVADDNLKMLREMRADADAFHKRMDAREERRTELLRIIRENQ